MQTHVVILVLGTSCSTKISNSEILIGQLASCLIYAMTRQMIGRSLRPFRQQPVPILPLVCVRSFIELDSFDYIVPFDNTTLIYLINLPWKVGLGLGLDLKLHYFSIFHGE